ncbi:hypothetical protein [Alcaligenes sp. SJTW-7]|uniref:hypothetical protein n=1 Tax=Alcaligenes sp. SJTW-7 TaxID=3078429 RepID=UPI0039ECC069
MRRVYALFLLLLWTLSPLPVKTQTVSGPVPDARIHWDQGQITQTALGPIQSWGLTADLEAHVLSDSLEPFCGSHYGAIRLQAQWVILRARDGRNCVLWVEDIAAPTLSGLLSVSEPAQTVVPSYIQAVAPVAGTVLWQHEQPGEAQSWLLLAEPGWQAELRRNKWGAETDGRYWQRGPAELDVMELEHEQQAYLLVICRACEKEAS